MSVAGSLAPESQARGLPLHATSQARWIPRKTNQPILACGEPSWHAVWAPNQTLNAQDRATKSHRNFLQRTHPIHTIGPQTNVLGRFGLFYYCTNFSEKWAELEQLMQSSCNEVVLEFFATNAPDLPHWTPNSCIQAGLLLPMNEMPTSH
jgi:hypothetical protein